MTDRRDEKGTTEQFHELFGADAFLDDLSRGVDPTGGQDPLAEMMLQLHQEVYAPMPAAPNLDELLPADQTQEHPVVVPEPVQEPEEEETAPVVASLDEHRRRRISPWMSGLVGAAAATLLIAGTGGAIYNASPDSPLWGAKTNIFGEHAAVVDLASALDEVDKRHANGDVDGAMQVLEQARILAAAVNAQDRQQTKRAIEELEAEIVEVPTTVTTGIPTTETSVETTVSTTTSQEPAEVLPPVVLTEVETVTVTVVQPTTVAVAPLPAPAPAPTPAPSVSAPASPAPAPSDDEAAEEEVLEQ